MTSGWVVSRYITPPSPCPTRGHAPERISVGMRATHPMFGCTRIRRGDAGANQTPLTVGILVSEANAAALRELLVGDQPVTDRGSIAVVDLEHRRGHSAARRLFGMCSWSRREVVVPGTPADLVRPGRETGCVHRLFAHESSIAGASLPCSNEKDERRALGASTRRRESLATKDRPLSLVRSRHTAVVLVAGGEAATTLSPSRPAPSASEQLVICCCADRRGEHPASSRSSRSRQGRIDPSVATAVRDHD
jgi:hypothetical protein